MNGGSIVCLRCFRTVDGVPFMRERVANLHHYGRLLIFYVKLIVRSFSTSERLHTAREVFFSVSALREIARRLRISAIEEEPGSSSCSQGIDVVKFYEPYRDRSTKVRRDLLLIVRCVPIYLDNTSRKLK